MNDKGLVSEWFVDSMDETEILLNMSQSTKPGDAMMFERLPVAQIYNRLRRVKK